MAKLLYVEPSDEITDLIDRIRRAEGERDLVFVVPPDGRVLRSPLDMRLLMQYTRGFQKRIAIVSGDPQIQAQALRTGFPTFASLARLEQGVALRGVPELGGAAAASTAALAAAAEEEGAGSATSPPTQLAQRGPTGLLAAGGVGAAGWWSQLRGLWDSQRGHQRLIAVSTGVVIVLLILLFLILPSATVTLGVRAHRLVDVAAVQGNDGANGDASGAQVTTQGLQSQTFSKTFTITPSGTQSLPPVPATGSLALCGSTSGSHHVPGPYILTFQSSPEFDDTTTSGVVFTTTPSSENGSYTVPECSTNATVAVPVEADSSSTVGTQGNVPANQGWSWNGDGAVIDGGGVNSSDVTWSEANPAAMTGGANATTQSVFSTADATAAQQKMQTVDTTLTTKAKSQLKRLAGKSVLAVDSNGKGIVVTVTNPPLPSGCNTSASTPCPAATTQNLTVTVSAAATAYSPAAVRVAVLKDLKSKVPKGSELLADPNLGKIKVLAAGVGGTATFSSRAVGYWAPKLDLQPLAGKLASMGTNSAKSYLLARLPKDSTVSISQSPIGWPWLPILSGHIHLVRVSLAAGRSSG